MVRSDRPAATGRAGRRRGSSKNRTLRGPNHQPLVCSDHRNLFRRRNRPHMILAGFEAALAAAAQENDRQALRKGCRLHSVCLSSFVSELGDRQGGRLTEYAAENGKSPTGSPRAWWGNSPASLRRGSPALPLDDLVRWIGDTGRRRGLRADGVGRRRTHTGRGQQGDRDHAHGCESSECRLHRFSPFLEDVMPSRASSREGAVTRHVKFP